LVVALRFPVTTRRVRRPGSGVRQRKGDHRLRRQHRL